MDFRPLAKAGALTALGVVILAVLASGSATAGSAVVTESSVYTDVRLDSSGGGHINQHILITNIAPEPIALGAMTLQLLKNDDPLAGVITPRNDYRNISVTRQDGTPVEYVLAETGGDVRLKVFSRDLLMTGWNCQFIVSYDVDPMISDNLVTKEFAYSSAITGTRPKESLMTVTLPEGSHVVYASPGASLQGVTLSWSGSAANAVSIEYASLPLPSSPVPLQYLFWGGLALVALAWSFKPRRLTLWR
jgi:hypothetical protein